MLTTLYKFHVFGFTVTNNARSRIFERQGGIKTETVKELYDQKRTYIITKSILDHHLNFNKYTLAVICT